MLKNAFILASLLVFVLFVTALSACGAQDGMAQGPNGGGLEKPIKVTILYDNYKFAEGTKNDWGFSCLIEGTEKTILFDTGTKPEILMHNIKQLNVDLAGVDLVVISHGHTDHTGGLFAVLEKKPGLPVYLAGYYPDSFLERVEKAGGKVAAVKSPEAVTVCENVFLTGVMGTDIEEQALILDGVSDKGVVVITGCSHPGIVDIIKRAGEIRKKKVYFVFGGFHLLNFSEAKVKAIVEEFKSLGVVKCGATHCTGDLPIRLFQEAYKDNYVKLGTGRILELR